MAKKNLIETGAARLKAALDNLEVALSRQEVAGKALGDLRQQMHTVAEDRSRLAQELDRLKQRTVKLESVNDDVAHRLQSAIGTIEELIVESGR